MRLFIDLDQHAAVQGFTLASAAPPPQFKSQDTIDFLIYFLQAGVVQDMGASFALKFGMIKTGDTTNTILAYQTASTYLTDPAGNVYYQMQVNFNTSQMATAIGTAASIPCTIEIRYQDALAEIIHSLNLSATVFQTILVETGVTPPGVSTGYPDASTIELLVHKNVASGYAGLNASSQINGSVVPIDGQTIALNGSSQLSSAAILAYTSANFTTPASGATVSVTFVSTSNLKAGSYVRIPIAGYYIVNSITNATTAVLQNNGDPFNAASGTTITSGAVVLPAQAAAGGGTAGQNAYTTLSAGFTVPNVGATVSINVASTAWMPGSGYAIYIGNAGYYLVSSITDATHAVVTNSGSAANAPPGTNVPSGGTVTGAGPQGATGAAGASLSAYDALAASFVMPAVSGTVSITIGNTAWLSPNQIIYIATAGYFQVATVVNATILNLTNLNYPGNATAGTTIASGSKVSPGGLQGPQGAGGPGLNAFTTLSANYVQPAVNAIVTVNVGTTAWMATGQGIFITGGGYYTVTSISDLTHAVVTNLGGSANIAAGSTVTGSGTQTVAPAGIPGTNGTNAYTATTANFTTPATGASVTVTVGNTGWASVGQVLFVAGAGYYQVAAILSATQLSLTNLAGYGNTAGGTTINSGATVSAAGVIGPAGAAGPQGPAGRDGAYSTVYAIDSIQGNGGVSSQLQLVGDVAGGTNPFLVYQRSSAGNPLWAAALLSAADANGAASGTEVSHIQSTASGVLSLKKLKPGATGTITLTDQGGTTGDILIDASGGAGGGGLITADTGIQVQEDFITAGTGTNPPAWNNGVNGGAVTFNVNVGCDATNKGAGVVSMTCGTTVNNRSTLSHGLQTTDGNYDHFVPALGVLELRFRVWISAIYSSTTTYSIVRCGLISDDGTGVIKNGIYFSYDYANGSGNWIAVTASGGTISRSATSIAVVAGQWMNLRIVTDAAWANASYYINGTLALTKSGFTLPTNNMPIAIYHAWAAGASGLSTLYVDYAYMKYTYSRGTW